MVKKFKVTGYAFVPVEVSLEVEASSVEKAKQKAVIVFNASQQKQNFILPETEDYAAVFDWLPSLANVV